jgi:hypothetical protein
MKLIAFASLVFLVAPAHATTPGVLAKQGFGIKGVAATTYCNRDKSDCSLIRQIVWLQKDGEVQSCVCPPFAGGAGWRCTKVQ